VLLESNVQPTKADMNDFEA